MGAPAAEGIAAGPCADRNCRFHRILAQAAPDAHFPGALPAEPGLRMDAVGLGRWRDGRFGGRPQRYADPEEKQPRPLSRFFHRLILFFLEEDLTIG
jgi:hypothetical protein